MTIAEHAYKVLKDSNNPALGYGDSGLCHMVAEAAGMPHEGWRTERKVLNALECSKKGLFIKRYFRSKKGFARVFYRFDADPFETPATGEEK